MHNQMIVDKCFDELEKSIDKTQVCRSNNVDEFVIGKVTIFHKVEDDGGLYIQSYFESEPLSQDDSLLVYNKFDGLRKWKKFQLLHI